MSHLYCILSVGYDKDRCPWWEAVILVRKFVLMCIVVFATDLYVQGNFCQSITKWHDIPHLFIVLVSIASWVIVASLTAQVYWRPYMTEDINRLDALVLVVIYVHPSLCSNFECLTISLTVYAGAVLLFLYHGPGTERLWHYGRVRYAEHLGACYYCSVITTELGHRHHFAADVRAHVSVHEAVFLLLAICCSCPA
jgi:hypothetical protein